MAETFVTWLQGEHDSIMGCEKDALLAMKQGNIKEYNEKMREKAQKLANLATEAKPRLKKLPAAQAGEIGHKLSQFSSSAQTSLNLGSVWFMSALLYPDEHKPGEPDNLEVLIKKLASGQD